MNKLLLIDGHSILNRAFYGLPDLTDSRGRHTGAVYGFLNIIFRIIDEEKPSHLCVAFDVSAPTFRHEFYPAYKGTRKPTPPELKEQVPLLKEVLKSMGVYILEKPGLEADDILGTMAKRAEKEGFMVTLISGDRDLLQIASDNILIRIPKTYKGKTEIKNYYAKDVLMEYQVDPLKFIELKALMGDTADNIPGIAGVGPKAATDLLLQFGSIDEIYKDTSLIAKKGLREKVEAGKDNAYLSLRLATINTDADIEKDFEKAIMGELFTSEAYDMFRELDFKNLLSRFDSSVKLTNDFDEVYSQIVEIESNAELKKVFEKCYSLERISVYILSDKKANDFEEESGQLSLFKVEKKSSFVMSMGLSEEEIYYFSSENINFDELKKMFIELCNKNICIITHNVKTLFSLFSLEVESSKQISKRFFDTCLAEYILYPLKSNPTIEDVAVRNMSKSLPEFSFNIEKESLTDILNNNPDDIKRYISLHSYIEYDAYEKYIEELKKCGEDSLFFDIEMPISYVLYYMEKEGMYVQKDALSEISATLKESIDVISESIYEKAGEEFNINSPKQLGIILFEKLGLEGGKKTKTGYSTSADVLEKLAEDNDLVADILKYRTLSKLRSTYAEGLNNFIGENNRIHSNFNQTITATGRISSDNPNMQNIPTRMEEGRKIRKVFTAPKDRVLIDADYSQIELRLLASFSEDEELIKAYNEHADIHTLTASKVFHVEPDDVTDLMRRNAKAVNFGIVYGISSFGLSRDLSISKSEAKQYIDEYFVTYPGIKAYLDNAKESAKNLGYSVTYTGRRRPIPELSSSNFQQRLFGERVAMNAPIQGSAADVMKIAMINVFDRLRMEKLDAKLVLQVHDELILEVSRSDAEKAQKILVEEMENAAVFSVKLEVSCQQGYSWYDAK